MMTVDKNQIDINGNIIEPENFNFNLICTKCGSTKTRLTPTSYYEAHNYRIPEKITLHMMCTCCHNDLEYIIFTKR